MKEENESTMYKMMIMSESMEEEAIAMDELSEMSANKGKSFKEEYKEFYTDIKLSVKEDW